MVENKPLEAFVIKGKYVFHGSPDRLEVLELRQPYTFSKDLKKMVPDGTPTVAASSYLEVAIFRAIVNSKNISGKYWSGFSYDDKAKKLSFRMSQSTSERLSGAVGYVHVLDRKDFSPRDPDRPDGMEWRSDKSVVPVEIIRVTADDLPDGIVIEPDPFGNQ